MTQRLAKILHALSAEPRSEHPVLSVYLDWSVDQSGKRQALMILDQELARHGADLETRGPRRDSFEADRERIARYVRDEAPARAKGIVIFACDARQIWVTISLVAPIATEIAVDDYPRLYQLAQLLDDRETYAVVLAEGQQAQIYVMSLEAMEQVEQTEARERVNRTEVGGWSQRRYESHTAFTIQLHVNEIAAALQQVVEEHDARHVVILTNDSIRGQIRQGLPAQLHERVVDMGAYQHTDDPEQLFASLEPLMLEAERQQEAELIGRLEEQLATKGGLAFGGEKQVAQALLKGQVDTLILDASYAGGEGGECPTCGMLRAGQRQNCPYDGSELQPVDLREGLVRHTLRQGGQVEIVTDAATLQEHGGVAAILRFRDDVQQEVGDGIA
jgi:peptide subunit release factor 1 (eRF1)